MKINKEENILLQDQREAARVYVVPGIAAYKSKTNLRPSRAKIMSGQHLWKQFLTGATCVPQPMGMQEYTKPRPELD